MTVKKFYNAPGCAYEPLGIEGLICASEFDGSVTEDLTVTEEYTW